MSKRVLLAGLFHETHTFLPETTPLKDFGCRRGDELLAAAGDASPLAAVVEVGREAGWEFLPAIDLRAVPSGTVEDSVLEACWEGIAETVAAADAPIDGVFLVLHGAMACVNFPDVEGELLERLRGLPQLADVPIAGVFDLHANFTARMARHADSLVGYRCNPHTDAHEASADAARILERLLAEGRRARVAYQPTDIIWPPSGTGTQDDPMRTLEQMARELEAADDDLLAVNVVGGFAHADTPETGVSFSAVTLGDVEAARQALEPLRDWAVANRELGNVVQPDVMTIVAELREIKQGPVVVVEPADNIGGGGPGDATRLLRVLLEAGIERAVVVLNDPVAVGKAAARAVGERFELAMGGNSGPLSGGPLTAEVELVSTSDGKFRLEDPHSHLASMWGMQIDMGPCAVVKTGGVTVLLTSRKTPPFDLGQLRSQGIEPEAMAVIGVKAAVAHRRAYDRIAAQSYWVETAGPCSCDLKKFPYQRVRRPVYPLDEV